MAVERASNAAVAVTYCLEYLSVTHSCLPLCRHLSGFGGWRGGRDKVREGRDKKGERRGKGRKGGGRSRRKGGGRSRKKGGGKEERERIEKVGGEGRDRKGWRRGNGRKGVKRIGGGRDRKEEKGKGRLEGKGERGEG